MKKNHTREHKHLIDHGHRSVVHHRAGEDHNIHTKKKKLQYKLKPIVHIILIAVAVQSAVLYYFYGQLLTAPPMPNLDLNEWWGPYPLDANQDLSIRPYKIQFTNEMINDLRERLLHRRPFPPPLENAGFTYGFNSNFLTQVLDYWKNNYNFHDRERFLNKYEHFVTNIQGLDIHFMHVKPTNASASGHKVVPLLMLHGWPSSVREFYEIIPKLTTPSTERKFVFEVIAPSLPGYGFSQGALRPGLGSAQVAVIMHNLMQRIGYSKYYVQGGDWGHSVGTNMATLFPGSVLGLHTTSPVTLHPLATIKTVLGSLWPSWMEESQLQERMYPLWKHICFLLEETGYLHIQATKPDTVGIALTDSPAGLAAYIMEKFSTWTNPAYRQAGDGNLINKYALTHLLDNVMIYWSTNTITSSMRLYAESFSSKQLDLKLDSIPTDVPTWGLKMRHELVYQPDSILALKYRNYLHSTVVEEGGHFAAFEMPDIVANDIYNAVDTFRQFHNEPYPKTKPEEKEEKKSKTVYDFTVKDINGKNVKLEDYKGHVLLIVNVASKCGLTDVNYEQLNVLHEKYSESKGLRILAFPCNQFGYQEPGSSEEILNFTKQKGVKFDIFEKVEVNGANVHPLWKFLKEQLSGTVFDDIKWNFSKFVINKKGVPVERLGPTVNPIDIEPVLAKYW